MNLLCPATIALLSLLGTLPLPAQFVAETAAEFVTRADLDGDGRSDAVLVDKATGNYRIGYGLANGEVAWVSARPSGLENITGFTVGRFGSNTADALAFTAPDANRVLRCAATDRNVAATPVSFYPTHIGPGCVLAMDVGGAGNSVGDDFVLGSILNSTWPRQLSLYRDTGTNPSALASLNLGSSVAEFANRLVPRPGGATLGGFMLRGATSDTFRAYNAAAGTLSTALALTGLPTNSFYAVGAFGNSPVVRFFFYQPNNQQGRLSVRPIVENPTNVFSFGAEAFFDFGQSITQVQIAAPSGTNQLLILFAEGTVAGFYDFDGQAAPRLRHTANPPEGESFTGAVSLPGGDVLLFSGTDGRSASSTRWHYANGAWTPSRTVRLPTLTSLTGTANLFQFENEPFVAAAPNLLRLAAFGDWTSAFNASALPNLALNSESFVSATAGLDNPLPIAPTPAHPQTHFGLANQYLPQISVFSLRRPVGDVVADVTLSPPSANPFASTIAVSFRTTPPTAELYYRLNRSGAWMRYTAPFELFALTTVSYYAKLAGSEAKTSIREAVYRFATPPATLDSDHDGVPDYVEVAQGLDPRGGSDSDGDGWSDLDEILSGTSPVSTNSRPGALFPVAMARASFYLLSTPRPLDGFAGTTNYAADGTPVTVYDLAGSVLGNDVTGALIFPVLTNHTALFSGLPTASGVGFVTAATEGRFDIVTTNAVKALGCELVSVVRVPDVSVPVSVPYTYVSGNITNAATNWINAARTAYGASLFLSVTSKLDHLETLAALLFEAKLAEILIGRGESAGTNLTLFPFRAADAGRAAGSWPSLLRLEAPGPNGEPAYSLGNVHAACLDSLGPTRTFSAQLRNLAAEVYRVSSRSNQVAPGRFGSPVDTLREFLKSGVLESNYAAAVSLTAAQRTQAWSGVAQALARSLPRPTTNLALAVRSDTFANPSCTLLDLMGGPAGQTRSLWTGSHASFRPQFQLPAGSIVHVFGFTDVSNAGCGSAGIEVLAASLDSVPAFTSTDTDGDLLPDDVERLLFGNLAQDGSGDFDGDGISNLQEIFDGTDPMDRTRHAVVAANLLPPRVSLEMLASRQLRLHWQWPEAYAERVQFQVRVAGELGAEFVPISLLPTRSSNGEYQLILPVLPADARFYDVRMSLR